MKLLKQHVRILIAIVIAAAVVVAGSIYAKNRVSQPVWNDVRIDHSITYSMGMNWEEAMQELQDAGLEPNEKSNAVPRKEGKIIGISFNRSFDDKTVRSIYYDISRNETDCVIYLAGIPLDAQTEYTDLAEVFGEADKKGEIEDGGAFYSWIDRENGLVIEVDANEKLLNFDLLPYEE